MARNPRSFFTEERRIALEDFMQGISDEDRMMLEEIGKFAAQELWPHEKYRKINNPDDHADFRESIEPLIDHNAGFGFRGSFLPEEAGGGISFPAYMTCLEMISQGNGSVALSLAIDGSVLNSVWRMGDASQRERFVKEALERKYMTSFCLTDPDHGTDAANLNLTASIDTGDFVLNGSKNWITNAGWAEYYLVVARTQSSEGGNGKSLIMVDGCEISEINPMQKHTVPGSYTGELYFDDAVVPLEDGANRLLGSLHTGFDDAKDLLMGGRVTIAAFALGLAQEAYDSAFDYAAFERQVQGEPLIQKQMIVERLGGIETRLDAARLMTYRAAMRMQEGKPWDYAEAAKAKLLATELARDATNINREIHGGAGTTPDSRCVELRNDTDVAITGEGTAELMNILVVSAAKQRAGYNIPARN